jgi:transcriptional regulator with XRE-family HTH domain
MLYDNVKNAAAKKGLSIAALEKKAELSNGTIGKWRIASPNVDSLIRVAKVLNVSIKKLIEE